MVLQYDVLERRASARASVCNHLKCTGQSLEFRPKERLGLVIDRIRRWIKSEFDVELHGTDDDRKLMARCKLRRETSGMVEIDRSVSRVGAAVHEASVNRSCE
ncbi:hypothetical protein PAHAL_2G142100 [Panicum hallii]|jgi:predicted phosphohydrolase|uniref:Uncharacterized protein n=1 Tax=Panicum hallii TaxID=206008 RepID=A0A2T8KP33_9POAL|nr:hypothetical protein PAHAL_2G142100 [Panicum hallii]